MKKLKRLESAIPSSFSSVSCFEKDTIKELVEYDCGVFLFAASEGINLKPNE